MKEIHIQLIEGGRYAEFSDKIACGNVDCKHNKPDPKWDNEMGWCNSAHGSITREIGSGITCCDSATNE